MIVLDASFVASALGDEGEAGMRLRAALESEMDIFVPELIDLEVASYARRAVRLGSMVPDRARQMLVDLALLPVRRISHVPFLHRIWELRENVTAYDAAYIALAEIMEAPLLTLDARLARAPGIRCEVRVLA